MAETLLMFNQEDQAWENINALEREVKTLQEYQIAVRQIDALLAQAKLDFDNHLFSFAFENAKRGIETAKQVMIDYSRASEEYGRCQALIQQVSTIGDPSSLLDSLKASEQDFANSDFKAAIEKCLESLRVGTEILRNATPQFEVEVLSKDIKQKTWNRVRFRVHNTGKVHASDVHTNCIGQVEVTVTPSAHVIPAGGCADIDMGINPPGEGEIPLELKVSAVARNTGKRCEISVPFWMIVGGSQGTQGRPAKAVRDFFSIDEIFLIYRDGRLILHHSVKGTTDLDDTVLSGMMVAMQNFVSDSFKAGGGLRRFTFDKYTIAMEKGNYVFLATVLEGRPPPELYETILDTIERLEMAYAGVIEEWDGATDRFKDATAMFEDVLSLSKRFGMDEAAELGVRIKSGLEFFRGFVRLKVGITNETDETATDGALLLTFNRKAMRLVKIEPEYEFEGSTVYIGTLLP